jgi:hypothetical protein
MQNLERFDTTIAIPDFGHEAAPTGRAIQHVIATASKNGLHLRTISVERGRLLLKGECDPDKLKAAIRDLTREITAIVRFAAIAAVSLPRSAED